MPRDRKYKTKNTNYVPGNVTDIVKEVHQANKAWDEGIRLRMPYLKDTKLPHTSASKIGKIKEEILK
jgi:hypothetical protein